ncbi:MAG: hypothetical protein KOO63_02940 [Bacteroidales bacterium]|nr:hypothetical protein [Candidatus Latescibacterota bacterium]
MASKKQKKKKRKQRERARRLAQGGKYVPLCPKCGTYALSLAMVIMVESESELFVDKRGGSVRKGYEPLHHENNSEYVLQCEGNVIHSTCDFQEEFTTEVEALNAIAAVIREQPDLLHAYADCEIEEEEEPEDMSKESISGLRLLRRAFSNVGP